MSFNGPPRPNSSSPKIERDDQVSESARESLEKTLDFQEYVHRLESEGKSKSEILIDLMGLREWVREAELPTLYQTYLGREIRILFLNIASYPPEDKKVIIESVFDSYPEWRDYLFPILDEHISEFESIDYEALIPHLIATYSSYEKNGFIFSFLKNIPEQYHPKVVEEILNRGHVPNEFFENLESFKNIDLDAIADRLLATKSGPIILTPYLHKFPNIDQNHVLTRLLANNGFGAKGHMVKLILENMQQFTNIDRDTLVDGLIGLSSAASIAAQIDTLAGLSQGKQVQLIEALIERDMSQAISLNGSITPPPVPSLFKFAKIMGSYASPNLYNTFLENGEDETVLKESVAIARRALLESDEGALVQIQNDPIALEAAKSFVRFDTAEWGNRGIEEFTTVITRYCAGRESYAPMPDGHMPGVLTVESAGKPLRDENGELQYSPEFTERWKVLTPSLQEALACARQPEKLVDLYTRFSASIEAEKREVQEMLEGNVANEYARKNLESRLALLESASVNSIEDMSATFQALYDRKKRPEFAELSRVFGFVVALKANYPDGDYPEMELVSSDTPTREDISKILSFTQHITHQETWEKNEFFATKEAQEGLNSLFHVKALEDELKRTQVGSKKGPTKTIDVLPSRDLLTELSGHIGDACWASRQEILKEKPNITSLTFLMNSEAAGAALLIDTETSGGEAITLIRGLNPLERVINKLDAESFIQNLSSYLTPIAENRGRKLAIVIDDHSGGSSTNRPLLFAYLSGLRQSLVRVKGISEKDTTFNGYDVTQNAYYLPVRATGSDS